MYFAKHLLVYSVLPTVIGTGLPQPTSQYFLTTSFTVSKSTSTTNFAHQVMRFTTTEVSLVRTMQV